jgi:hypothetical protein
MSDSSGRYQSRILSFVSHHTQKVTDRAETWLRRLKVTTIWSAQIILYPIYAVFQTLRLGGRQLHQAVQQVWQKLPIASPQGPLSPSSDEPIDQIMGAVGEMGVPVQLPASRVRLDRNHPPRLNEVNLSEMNSVGEAAQSGDWFGRSLAWVRTSVGSLGKSLVGWGKSDELASGLIASPTPAAPLVLQSPLVSVPTLSDSAPSPASQLLQGIASLCESRCLVLVTTGNQILNILTAEQQQQVQRRITLALASYWYAGRRTIATPSGSLPLPRDRDTSLPPVRLLTQLMAWMQTGPVAGALNLFQEATIVQLPEVDWFRPTVPLSEFQPPALLPSQLPAVADLPALIHQLPPLSELPLLIQAAIRYFFGTSRRLWAAAPRAGGDHTAIGGADALGLRTAAPLTPADGTPTKFTIAYLPDRTLDPWLTLSELFGEPVAANASPTQMASTMQLALPPAWAGRLPRSVQRWMQGSLVLQLRGGAMALRRAKHSEAEALHSPMTPTDQGPQATAKTAPSDLVAVTSSTIEAAGPRSAPVVQSHPSPQVTPILAFDMDLDWIDTSATSAGYVKHPLTQLLEWFDQAMAWLENRLIALWNGWVRLLR